ncbi:MAG: transposase [Bacilli bacterium]|jgi:transposase
MTRKKRRSFSDEQKAEAVKLVRVCGESIVRGARYLGLAESSLRNWVNQDKIDRGEGREGELTTEEREKLRVLRRENRRLRPEVEIQKKGSSGSSRGRMSVSILRAPSSLRE